ncbi:SPOR domain-containing protein [Virgibacillus sp. MSJ-26]|uniref:SPOR domain-containing protein n=1 Tax=Virgibacillus sp. MSJ-26 TaxID=2841522 RepID=UPI001C1229CA|nr:SPOR domain-containing protein [Virgibacillus sp. MSJ-26]MBU5465840.1 SPOR domain-containing protein [Virgibacillus sp. MSJ-26]
MEKFKIVVGTTTREKNAQGQYNLMTDNKINTNIKVYKTADGKLYRVETEMYSRRKQALQDIDKIKKLGIKDAFIIRE